MKLKRLNELRSNKEKPKLDHGLFSDAFIDEKFGDWEVSDVIGYAKNTIIINFWNAKTSEDCAIKFDVTNIELGIFNYDEEGEEGFIPTEKFKL